MLNCQSRLEGLKGDGIVHHGTILQLSRVFHWPVRSEDSLVRQAVRFRADNSPIIIHAWPEIARRPALGWKTARGTRQWFISAQEIERNHPEATWISGVKQGTLPSTCEGNIFGAGPCARPLHIHRRVVTPRKQRRRTDETNSSS